LALFDALTLRRGDGAADSSAFDIDTTRFLWQFTDGAHGTLHSLHSPYDLLIFHFIAIASFSFGGVMAMRARCLSIAQRPCGDVFALISIGTISL